MEEASRHGVPLMRPMFMEFPEDAALASNGEEYMFGSGLLVAPKVWPFVGTTTSCCLKEIGSTTGLERRLPEEERSRSILRLKHFRCTCVRGRSFRNNRWCRMLMRRQGTLDVRVYPGPDCRGDLY